MNIILKYFIYSLWIVSIFYNWNQLFFVSKHIIFLFSFVGVFILKSLEFFVFLIACWLLYECFLAIVHIQRFRPSCLYEIHTNNKVQEELKEIPSIVQTSDFEDNELYKRWMANESVHQELGMHDFLCFIIIRVFE